MTETKTMPVICLYTFGYKHKRAALPEYAEWGGFVFDCRGLPNPFWDPELKAYTGLQKPVISFFESKKEVARFVARAAELIKESAVSRSGGLYPRIQAYFGCTGGKHRSVYIAEQVKKRLKTPGAKVRVTHLDYKKG